MKSMLFNFFIYRVKALRLGLSTPIQRFGKKPKLNKELKLLKVTAGARGLAHVPNPAPIRLSATVDQ